MYAQRIVRKYLYLALVLLACALSACGTSVASTPHAAATHPSKPPTPTPTPKPTPIPVTVLTPPSTPHPSQPVRLLIPAIGVNASIEHVGITSTGNLSTAQKSPWDDVGWLSSGTYPGQSGSAVIDGHVDRPGGSPAVFWYLSDLQPGDEVSVVQANNAVINFRVIRTAFYSPSQAPLQSIFGDGSGKYLNLITCAGYWVPSQNQTTLRFVAYTEMISS
jgi:sortase (surface protein transpeptidase)